MPSKWVLVQNQKVAQIEYLDPAGRYHPDLVFIELDISHPVQLNWDYNGGVFSAPVVAEPAVVTMTAGEFYVLLPMDKQVALTAAAATDPVLQTLRDYLTMAGAIVRLGSDRTRAMVEYLAGGEVEGQTIATPIITPPEAEALLRGEAI